jgi:hypothetical protein
VLDDHPTASPHPALPELRADCSRCAGLCCVAPAFARSSDFPFDKPAGTPCLHLRHDDRCEVHDRLRPLGFVGCTVYDCFGAGQRTVQQVYDGQGWRSGSVDPTEMFAVFEVVRDLHELLWLLGEVLTRPEVADLHADAAALAAELDAAVVPDATAVLRVDTAGARDRVAPLLRAASSRLRPAPGRDLRHADLVGRRFRGDELAAADLSGALLLGADLRGCDLVATDLLGADLRGCDLAGADLTGALFLTQVQVTAAKGDAATRLPERLDRPGHW